MNIFVYSDESGVFDKIHNEFFVFGGLILLGTDEKNKWTRKYSNVEETIRTNKKVDKLYELKATHISNKEKSKLFRSLNDCIKFGVIINQNKILDRIFQSKKDKQRYLDFAYKIAVKRAFQSLIINGTIKPEDIDKIFFYVDEHTTATNGRYELKEGLEREFKLGTFNYCYDRFYPPIFNCLSEVQLEFCNSASKILVRASDIVANKIYFLARSEGYLKINEISNAYITFLP